LGFIAGASTSGPSNARADVEQPVGEPGGQCGNRVRRRRANQHGVGEAGEFEVVESRIRLLTEHVDPDGVARECGECLRTDKPGGVLGHHDADVVSRALQLPHKVDRLVGGDSTADAEHDVCH
jgi:hypothetical protein